MSCGRDEVEQSVNSVVTEAGITLDTRLFGQDIVVLTFKVSNNFLKANNLVKRKVPRGHTDTNANSLSMLSPKPGVSTMVRAIRTPSSSSSAGGVRREGRGGNERQSYRR